VGRGRGRDRRCPVLEQHGRAARIDGALYYEMSRFSTQVIRVDLELILFSTSSVLMDYSGQDLALQQRPYNHRKVVTLTRSREVAAEVKRQSAACVSRSEIQGGKVERGKTSPSTLIIKDVDLYVAFEQLKLSLIPPPTFARNSQGTGHTPCTAVIPAGHIFIAA